MLKYIQALLILGERKNITPFKYLQKGIFPFVLSRNKTMAEILNEISIRKNIFHIPTFGQIIIIILKTSNVLV